MKLKLTICSIICLLSIYPAIVIAEENPKPPAAKNNRQKQSSNFLESCQTAQAQFDLDINNVRARLLTGGDMWWNRSEGKYIVPKPAPGKPAVSAIFAAGIWMGGLDAGGSLKMACQTYGNNGNGNSDYWPGPLITDEGITSSNICNNWDRFFEVKGTEIREHLNKYNAARQGGPAYTETEIPLSVKLWPAMGNPYFLQNYLFPLPHTDQGLAPFHDLNGDGLYNPLDGDFPIIEMQGCNGTVPQYPDQMVFWIYNDEGGGNVHGETNGYPIHMEVQAQSFAFETNDPINDMTFQHHKFINRAKEDVDSFYFALWVDPALGCPGDDYIGCSPDRDLSYWYNADDLDDVPGLECDAMPTYGSEIPALGIDIIAGPINEFGEALGMTSFIYYVTGLGDPGPGVTAPNTDIEFYRFLTGSWRDGTPLTFGGSGYDQTSNDLVKYAFNGLPNDSSAWSMCNPGSAFPQGLPTYDRSFIQSCGPLTLQPGAVNELTFGVVYAPNLDYPCPNLNKLFIADDFAQDFFDNCMVDLAPGPDAPDIEWIALDQEIVGVLSNKPAPASNNHLESYEEKVYGHPLGVSDSTYNFEGYLVYQLANPNVRWNEIDDPEKARLVFQSDLNNGVGKLINWKAVSNPVNNNINNPSNYFVYQPEKIIEGKDEGLRHSFSIKEDLFATGDRKLINHRKYYFIAIAYAANNYKTFDAQTGIGQREMFRIGNNNIGANGDGLPYTVMPRPIIDQNLNASYGDGPAITRVEGVGMGGNYLDMSDVTLAKVLDGSFDGEITYKPGKGPFQVKIFNPFQVVDGEYELRFFDENLSNDQLDSKVNWKLTRLGPNDIVLSDKTIEQFNEQLFGQYGFSITIGQTLDAGDCENEAAGAIGASLDYTDPLNKNWFNGIGRGFASPTSPSPFNNIFGYLPSFFPNICSQQPLVELGDGFFVPYKYCDHNIRPDEAYLTPAWKNTSNNSVQTLMNPNKLPNIDIVFTPNKAHWSRCVVVETRNVEFNNLAFNEMGQNAKAVGNARQFDLRISPSVGKEDNNGDGLPDTDGDGIGMGWFPGYAVDVETGQRLNIFFGENSAFSAENGFVGNYLDGRPNGADMMFNPSSQVELGTVPLNNMMRYLAGGQHFIYVTNESYDGCTFLRAQLDPNGNDINRIIALKNITWTSMPLLMNGERLLSYADGLIPNELHVKLRVDNPYAVAIGTGDSDGYPTYRFKLEGVQPNLPDAPTQAAQLDQINIVPNPYYAFSEYEVADDSRIVKITNLPAKCEVTIFTLDGIFVRKYSRNEIPRSDGPWVQHNPDIEWDLKNSVGIPVASGVFLLHIDAPGIGERTLKFFCINRATALKGR